MVEQLFCKQQVAGPNPTDGSSFYYNPLKKEKQPPGCSSTMTSCPQAVLKVVIPRLVLLGEADVNPQINKSETSVVLDPRTHPYENRVKENMLLFSTRSRALIVSLRIREKSRKKSVNRLKVVVLMW